jgi:hypothetical protein
VWEKQQVWAKVDVRIRFLLNLKEGDHFEGLSIAGRIILKRHVGREWTGLVWHRTVTSCELLAAWKITFAFHSFFIIGGVFISVLKSVWR